MSFDRPELIRFPSGRFRVHINYLLLFFALVLLWMPRQWLRSGRRAARALHLRRSSPPKRSFRPPHEMGANKVYFREQFTKPRNYVDLFRAFTGGLAVVGNPYWGVSSCFVQTDAGAGEDPLILWLKLAILLVAVGLQFIRREQRLTFFAPLFYLAGLVAAMSGPGAGLSAFLLIWMFNSALPMPTVSFLSLFALLAWLAGLLFNGIGNVYVYAAAVLCMLPVLVSLMARRSLTMITKKLK